MAWQRKAASDVAAEYALAAQRSPGNEKVLNQLYRWAGSDKKGRVRMFEKVSEARPREPLVAVFLAFAQKEAGDLDGGLRTLAAAEKTMPESPYVPLNRGHLLLEKGDSDGAVKAYERAVEASTQFVKAIFDDVNVKVFTTPAAAMTPAQREKLWNALWRKWPDAVDTANNAGLWYRDAGKDFKKSSSWYLRAVEAAPESPQVLNDTALIFDQYLGEHELAEPYYRRAVDAGAAQGRDWRGGDVEDTGYRDAINNFGAMLAKQKRWRDLREFCDEHVPEAHPARGGWRKLAEQGK
jgi:tetratricopeptide (TPR) repeat protein